jgi:hypothetical protein
MPFDAAGEDRLAKNNNPIDRKKSGRRTAHV